jgi:hypothetical protein
MFLTPTLLQQEPGAQTATVSPTVLVGDRYETVINGVGDPAIPAYTATAGDTAATVAKALAANITRCTTSHPAWGNVPLSRRFYASSQGGVVTIIAGPVIDTMGIVGLGAHNLSYGPVTGDPLSSSAPISGTPTPGTAINTIINADPTVNGSGLWIPYTVQPTDTTAAQLAAGIANAINTTTTVDPWSGLPVNRLLYTFASGATINFITMGAGGPFALECTYTSPSAGTSYTAPTPTPPLYTASVDSGNFHPNNVYTTAIATTTSGPGAVGVTLDYVAGPNDTPLTVAQNIAAKINACTTLDPATNLALNAEVQAVAAAINFPPNSGLVSIIPTDPATPITLSCGTAADPFAYTPAGNSGEEVVATLTGTIPPGAILTTLINDVAVTYPAAVGDTNENIANNIANLVDANPNNLKDAHGTALNNIVTAGPTTTASGDVGILFSGYMQTSSFTLTASLSAGGYTAGRAKSPFDDDGYGNYLPVNNQPGQTLFAHEATVCAACKITGPEFALITGHDYGLDYTPATPLGLEYVSAVFRRAWLAHALGLSIKEFLQLRSFAGLSPSSPSSLGYPFDLPPEVMIGQPGPPGQSGQAVAITGPADVMTFIELVQALNNAGLIPAQVLYLMWNTDNAGTFTPPQSVITGLAATLVGDFASVDAQFVLPPGGDPDGSIANKLMTLVYGATTTATFFGLLNGTFTTSVPYSVPAGQNTLPDTVFAAAAGPNGQLSYDNLAKKLTFSGVLTPSGVPAIDHLITLNLIPNTYSAIQAAVVANPNFGTALGQAIDALHTANQHAVTQFFAAYPELASPYGKYIASASADTLQSRRTTLLESLLPILRDARKREQALASVSSAAAADPSFATALLQDPTVLHADTDPSAPAISDLVAIQNQGLTAQFYLNNDTTSGPDQIVDSTPTLSYAQTATIGGTINTTDVFHTTINGATPPLAYTVTNPTDTTTTGLAASIATAINAWTQPVPTSPGASTQLPANQLVTATSDGPTVVVRGRDPSGANGVFTLQPTTSSATASYTPGSQLPPGTTGSGITAVWSGYLTVPQNGFYDINIATDAAQVTVEINGAAVAGGMNTGGTLWSNLAAITLTAGTPIPVTLTATSLKTTFAVDWTAKGIGWQPIPATSLFAQNLVTRLGDTYIRFLKAATLASALTLTAAEIAYLGTAPIFAVNTTCTSTVSPGVQVRITPVSITNITAGMFLVIDAGPNSSEVIKVVNVDTTSTPPTFTAATVTKPHDGTTTPFPIISQPQPRMSQGWLNYLTPQGAPSDPTDLAAVLNSLLNYARIKQALSPHDQRLLVVLADPTATLPGAQSGRQRAMLSLTGWPQDSLNALLTHFFPGVGLFPADTTAATLCSIDNFTRIYDAYTQATATRVSPGILMSVITNTPNPATVGALQSALRTRYAESDWLTVIGPINDAARIAQRDALVAYILDQKRKAYESSLITLPLSQKAVPNNILWFADVSGLRRGMPVAAGSSIAPGTTIAIIIPPGSGNDGLVGLTSNLLRDIPVNTPITFAPADAIPITDSDGLYDLLLVDTQTQPAVLTSRIRLALSTVQLFIERIIRNLEPTCAAADIDTARWKWMRTYRMWQANREVFLWPENWAYPQLRDDQSPSFQKMMQSLLQGDITDDAAANAYLDYLTDLADVAKLEPCGMYYQPAGPDTDETTYVVARTADTTRTYYFRELTGGSWTPWTQVSIDCDDNPLTPVAWDGRLFLFWLKVPDKKPSASSPPSKPAPPAPPSINDNEPQNGWTLAQLPVKNLQNALNKANDSASKVTASVALCWVEYYNGRWTKPKTSGLTLPQTIGTWSPAGGGTYSFTPVPFDPTGDGSFDAYRGQLRLVPIQLPDGVAQWFYPTHNVPSDSLTMAIMDTGYGILLSPRATIVRGGFVLYNTHSLPIRFSDLNNGSFGGYVDGALKLAISGNPYRQLPPTTGPYTGADVAGAFSVIYSNRIGGNPVTFADDVVQFKSQPRWVDTQPLWLWGTPFLFEDRRAQFYVTSTIDLASHNDSSSFGASTSRDGAQNVGDSRPLILNRPMTATASSNGFAFAGTSPLLSLDPNIHVALAMPQQVTYQGRLIMSAASTNPLAPPPAPSSAIREGRP